MPYLTVNDLKIYYELHGEGEPLVLIAGYTCDVTVWTTILANLSKRFQVLIFDNRGAGRSDAPDIPYTIEMMADDALQLAEALRLKPYAVLGHSMGGCIAQSMARKAPNRITKLILANTSAFLSHGVKMNFRFFYELRAIGTPMELMLRGVMPWLYSDAFLSNRKEIRAAIRETQADPYPQSLAGQKGQMEALAHFDSRQWCSSITMPALIIAGEKDLLSPLADAEHLAGQLTNSQLVILPNMGHVPSLEKPKLFSDTVLQFLSSN